MLSQVKPHPPRIFYGWYVVAAATVVAIIGNGLQSSFGVFLKPLSESFDWSRSLTAGAFMFYMVCRGFSGIVMGGLSDRHGPRLIVGIGGFLMGLGMLLGVLTSSAWHLYVFYGLLVGVGMGVGGVPLWATVSRWFVARRGLALGIVGAGAGVGYLIAPPIAGYLIRGFGINSAYLIMGAASLALISLSTLALRQEPRDMGLQPYGVQTASKAGNPDPDGKEIAEKSWGVSQMLRSGPLRVLSAAFFCFGTGLFIIMTNLVAHATDLGVSRATAPYLLSIIGGASALGMLVSGPAADKVGARRILVICLALQALVVFWLTGASSLVILCVIAALFGLGFGGVIPQLPNLGAEFFGLKSLGTVLGFLMLMLLLGAALGSEVGNLIYDLVRPHSYVPAFWLSGGLFLAATILALVVRRPHRRVAA